MMWNVLVWLLAFIGQACLLGLTMYGLITFSDLEQDYLNPHNASENINRLVYPEYGVQAFLTMLLLLTGKWVAAALQLLVAAWNVRTVMRGTHLVDVTEIYREVASQRKVRVIKLFVHLAIFTLTIYRFVESIVAGLSPDGRETARQLFQDAAASF